MDDGHSLLPLAQKAGGFLIGIATILLPFSVILFL